MSGESTKKANEETEPAAESFAEMPEISDSRFRRRAGSGHHGARSAGGAGRPTAARLDRSRQKPRTCTSASER
jgi:hypothetical protein